MASAIVICILGFIVAAGLAYLAGKWYFKVDEAGEDRRRAAGVLAIELAKVGFVKLPAFLNDYAVGDYSSMVHKMKNVADMATSDPAAFMKEFDEVYNRVLDAKLKTEEGRVLLAAKLQGTSKPSDPSVVAAAPKVAVTA